MKRIACLTLAVVITFLTFNILIDICEGRGGRGRGGGSIGGIFGGWRKYKKPSSNSNSRRTISSSPMQTTATKPVSVGASQASMNSKQPASYPKQQMPLGSSGHNAYASHNGNYAAGTPPLPPGSTFYQNMGAIPPGAIYYPQPMRSSSGTGDFLVGMLAGHMASNMLFGPRHYVTHVHHENGNQNSGTGPTVIVVNNGEATLNTTSTPTQYWPTDTDTPLEPFNESMTPSDALQPGKDPVFQRTSLTNPSNVHQMTEIGSQKPPASAYPPTNGIICIPVLLNETNPDDPSQVQQVERVICFPAPPPTPPSESANANCAIRSIIETDPNDPSKTIEVPKEICNTPTTTLEPRQVAGEIGESATNETVETFLTNNENKETQGVDGTVAATTKRSFGASTESEIPTAVETEN